MHTIIPFAFIIHTPTSDSDLLIGDMAFIYAYWFFASLFITVNAFSRSLKNSVVVGWNIITRNATLKVERTKEPI
jgi:hypothetical protein